MNRWCYPRVPDHYGRHPDGARYVVERHLVYRDVGDAARQGTLDSLCLFKAFWDTSSVSCWSIQCANTICQTRSVSGVLNAIVLIIPRDETILTVI